MYCEPVRSVKLVGFVMAAAAVLKRGDRVGVRRSDRRPLLWLVREVDVDPGLKFLSCAMGWQPRCWPALQMNDWT